MDRIRHHDFLFWWAFLFAMIPLFWDPFSVFPYEFIQGQVFMALVIVLAIERLTRGKFFSFSSQWARRFVHISIGLLVVAGISGSLSSSWNIAFWGSSIRHHGILLLIFLVISGKRNQNRSRQTV
jgi:hypothetical protein